MAAFRRMTRLLCSTVFIFSYFFFFILGRAVAGLTASFRAHVNIVSLVTYLLTYENTLTDLERHTRHEM